MQATSAIFFIIHLSIEVFNHLRSISFLEKMVLMTSALPIAVYSVRTKCWTPNTPLIKLVWHMQCC